MLAVACGESPYVTSQDAATTDALTGPLTLAGVQTLTFGVLAQDRSLAREFNYLLEPMIFARDAYRIDPNEPRYVNETLAGQPDPASFSGSAGWGNGYTAIRAANSLLDALPGAVQSQISTGQRQTVAGLVQTMKALDYYRLLEIRDTNGIAIQTSNPQFVPPLSCKKNVLDYIAGQLDSAYTNLQAAGTASTPFTLPTGFTAYGRNYGSAANLALLNRGLKGKVDIYRALQHTSPTSGANAAAITELTTALGGAAPGAVSPSTFKNGAYVTFVAGGTENTPNPLSDSRVGVNPKAFAALQAGDTRSAKIYTKAAIAGFGITTTYNYVGANTGVTSNLTNPIAILRDEELVLLRAQAYFEAGQFANGAADLNSVRTAYGLTAIATPADLATARAALIYEKRFSLFWEGPQRLVDMRAYSMLKAGLVPAEVAGDPFNTALPIPKTEADARGGNVAVVCQ
jgi:hypothetical protein